MSYLQWSDGYSVGIESIDREHREIFNLLNRFYEEQHAPREQVELLLEGLIHYSMEHFSTEERNMEWTEYPHYEEHREEHAFFLDKVVAFDRAFRKGDLQIGGEIIKFITDWILNHVRVTDQHYSRHFLANNIK